MSNVFFVAAVISGVVALGGFVWSSAAGLRARRQETRTVEETRDALVADEMANAPIDGGAVESRTGLSIAGVGRLVRQVGWRRALPGLMTAGGILTLLVFAALALFTSLPSKLFGVVALGVAASIVVTELHSFRRALRD
jgi:hypothetical protein